MVLALLVLGCFLAAHGGDFQAMFSNKSVQMINPGLQVFLKKNAKEFKKDEQKTDDCAICMENFVEGDGKMIAELNCNNKHIFHLECLSEWVKKNDTCPLCRE